LAPILVERGRATKRGSTTFLAVEETFLALAAFFLATVFLTGAFGERREVERWR